MCKFYKTIFLASAAFLALSLTSCCREAAFNQYMAAGMPPELANNGVMIMATPGPSASVQEVKAP